MAKPRITPELDAEIMARAARGESSDSIAAWLKKAHRVVITGRSIRTRLAATRSERGDVVKAVLREKLAQTVLTDIDHLERIRAGMQRRTEEADEMVEALKEQRGEDGRVSFEAMKVAASLSHSVFKCVDLEIKAIHTKLHFSGADSPDDASSELTTAGERIRSRLARLAPDAGAKPPPEGAGGNTG